MREIGQHVTDILISRCLYRSRRVPDDAPPRPLRPPTGYGRSSLDLIVVAARNLNVLNGKQETQRERLLPKNEKSITVVP